MAKIIVITTDSTIFEQATGRNSEDMESAGHMLRNLRLNALKDVLRDLEKAERYEECAHVAKDIAALEKINSAG